MWPLEVEIDEFTSFEWAPEIEGLQGFLGSFCRAVERKLASMSELPVWIMLMIRTAFAQCAAASTVSQHC